MTMPGGSARSVALAVLELIEREDCYADEAIHRSLLNTAIDQRERGLMMELVYGVLRHRLRLDWHLNHVADRGMERLPSAVANALRLGAYQILRLTKIPHSAAVHETVTLVRRQARGPRWPGFANAVLRSLIRTAPPSLPALALDPLQSLSIRYSCPGWLVERWVARLGLAGAEALCQQTCEAPPLTVRVQTSRTSRVALLEAWRAAGLSAGETLVSPVGLEVEKCGSPAQLPGYADGAFYVEDEAAQLVALALAVEPGDRVLDACAAPGGKAFHLAELLGGRGELVAVDRSPERLAVMRTNLMRLGAKGLQLLPYDWLQGDGGTDAPTSLRQPFDRILVDAPCSGLGILRRHPEGKWQKQTAHLIAQQERQRRILAATARLLRPGGVIVYSTCSIEPEETVHIIDDFCGSHQEFTRESVAPWLPPAASPFVTARGELCTAPQPEQTQPEEAGEADGGLADERSTMDVFFAARLRRRG